MQSLFPPEVVTAFAVCTAAGLATLIGSVTVIRGDSANPRLLSFGLAFAGGAMVYVSLVEIFGKSLLSFSELYIDKTAYAFATLFLFVGIGALVLIDRLIPNPHARVEVGTEEDRKAVARVAVLTALAITAHNFPEGLATFFATLDDPVVGAPLAIAIAIHNIPEGVSIALPIYYATGSKSKAVLATLGSGLAEPVGALIGYLALASILTPFVFGAVFAVIAGAMVFLSLDELLPAAKRYAQGHETVYGMVSGMAALALSLVLFR